MNALVNKRCEGYNRIPLSCIADAENVLLRPMSLLFERIYFTQKIPEQWKVSKIIPVLKKAMSIKLKTTGQLRTCAVPLRFLKDLY